VAAAEIIPTPRSLHLGRAGRAVRAVVATLPDGTPYYAPYGEIVVDGDVVQCHLCGHWFRSALAHLPSHGWNQQLYRETFGLELRASLEGRATREQRARVFRRRRRQELAVQTGCREGQRWVRSGALAQAAAAAARGRPQPEQRRRKTLATLAAVTSEARAAGTRRATEARLRQAAVDAAAALGFDGVGAWIQDRADRGDSLAAISREAGLHKDWLCRHLAKVDPDAALVATTRDTAPEDRRWLPVVIGFGFPDVAAYLADRHAQRHMTAPAIGREAGIPTAAVRSALRRHGLTYTPHATTRRRMDDRAAQVAARFGFPDLDSYLRDRRKAGHAWRVIAAESGRPATWLRRRYADS
jgi:hypothetical protein